VDILESSKYDTREKVADYLHISRMTLYRMEKILRLPQHWSGKRNHIRRLTASEIKQWHKEYWEKIAISRIRRPQDVTQPGNVTSTG